MNARGWSRIELKPVAFDANPAHEKERS